MIGAIARADQSHRGRTDANVFGAFGRQLKEICGWPGCAVGSHAGSRRRSGPSEPSHVARAPERAYGALPGSRPPAEMGKSSPVPPKRRFPSGKMTAPIWTAIDAAFRVSEASWI